MYPHTCTHTPHTPSHKHPNTRTRTCTSHTQRNFNWKRKSKQVKTISWNQFDPVTLNLTFREKKNQNGNIDSVQKELLHNPTFKSASCRTNYPQLSPTDINECLKPNVCGSNAVCINQVGNHTCQCLEGFQGNPYDGVSLIFFPLFFNKIFCPFIFSCSKLWVITLGLRLIKFIV